MKPLQLSGRTETQQDYARYEGNEGLECLGVLIPIVPRTGEFVGYART
jgi:hypothetical protein